LDRRPLFPGHCLVIPREHVGTLPELPPALLAPLFETVRRIARAVVAGVPAHGSLAAVDNVVRQSVPPLPAHVAPARRGDGVKGFFWPRPPYAGAEARESMRQAIARAAAEAGGEAA